MKFPFYRQPDRMDCGVTCLRMVAKYHGRSISMPTENYFQEKKQSAIF